MQNCTQADSVWVSYSRNHKNETKISRICEILYDLKQWTIAFNYDYKNEIINVTTRAPNVRPNELLGRLRALCAQKYSRFFLSFFWFQFFNALLSRSKFIFEGVFVVEWEIGFFRIYSMSLWCQHGRTKYMRIFFCWEQSITRHNNVFGFLADRRQHHCHHWRDHTFWLCTKRVLSSE